MRSGIQNLDETTRAAQAALIFACMNPSTDIPDDIQDALDTGLRLGLYDAHVVNTAKRADGFAQVAQWGDEGLGYVRATGWEDTPAMLKGQIDLCVALELITREQVEKANARYSNQVASQAIRLVPVIGIGQLPERYRAGLHRGLDEGWYTHDDLLAREEEYWQGELRRAREKHH